MQVVIRKYRPSDREVVRSLFSTGILENIYPCFRNAMSSPLHIIITVALSAAGFLLGSVLGALVLPGIWAGFIYYCCHELHFGFVRVKLQSDMQDITRSYLSRPDDCFWVAEAEVGGTSQIIGTVAVQANQHGGGKQVELSRLRISQSFRRKGLGSRLVQTVIGFCKERGFSELVLQTSASRTPAVNLYKKLGFHVVLMEFETCAPFWISRLAYDLVVTMKTPLKSSKKPDHLSVMQVVIRKYRASDREVVRSLFSTGVLENIYPCFRNAMSSPLYIIITVALSATGFLLGSVLGALVLPGIWAGFIYYCCHELHFRFVRVKLQSDMQDITRSYLSRPDDCFWVAEAEVGGTSQVIGTVAVQANQHGGGKQVELSRLRISQSFRRKGLGSRLVQTVIGFCKERGFSELVLQTSASRTAALILYKKLGFHVVLIEHKSELSAWIIRLANDPVVTMKKHLKSFYKADHL